MNHASQLFSLILLLGMFASEVLAEKRVALVVGNSAYAGSPLANPVNDATAIAKKLGEMGFDVVLKNNVGQRDLTRALSDFGERITPGAVALFYYAGHGIQARGKNFLIPIDADIRSESAVSSEAVDVERVLDQLGRARLSMVVLDACRNNPFERRFRSGTGRGLAQIDAPTGTLIAYATAPGKVALDGNGSHAPYTEALLNAMDTPGLRVEDVFKQVRIHVLKATGEQQIPWEASSLTGEFMFRPAVVVEDPRRIEAEKNAAAMQEQLRALATEMARMRELQAKAITKPEPEQRRLEQDASGLRDQLAALSAEVAKLRQAQPVSGASVPSTPGKVEQETAALRQQLALINAELANKSGRAPVAQYSDEWKKQLEKIRTSGGKPTFLSAMQQLLNVTSPDQLGVMQSFERSIGRQSHRSAFAMGVDSRGLIVWGGGYNWRSNEDAADTAIQFCARNGASACAVVLANGEFDERGFFKAMSQLSAETIDKVRTALIDSMRRPVAPVVFSQSTGTSGSEFYGYSSANR